MAKLEVCEELVSHHVEEEQQQLFVVVRDLELIEVEVVGRKLKQRYAELIGAEPRKQLAQETRAAASLPC